jgi:hypothetical protein
VGLLGTGRVARRPAPSSANSSISRRSLSPDLSRGERAWARIALEHKYVFDDFEEPADYALP